MNVTIVGHVVPGAVSVVTGTIRVKSQNFQWAYPPPYPSVTFTPTTVSAPSTFPLSADRSTPLALYWVGFVAVDDVGAESPIGACKIQVTASLSLVAVAGLTLDRAQVVANQQATVKMIVRNTTSGPLASVPWMIWASQPAAGSGRGGGGIIGGIVRSSPPRTAMLGSGVQQNVPAGASFEVTAPWTPSQIGTYYVVGEVDPQNTSGENQSERANNRQQVTVSVATAAPSPYHIPPASRPQAPTVIPRLCTCPSPPCFKCSIDADCTRGYICCDGICVSK